MFLQLLPRSSTGERMNPYTSMRTGMTPGDGPQEFHLVLVDNGRTAALADPAGRSALHCIRCSACLNVCPVYERTGGHAYGSVYPGPIGAVLSPQLTGIEENASLPYASSLCGACYDACPVKINIPELLVHLRARHVEEALAAARVPSPEAITMAAASWVMSSPRRFAAAQSAGRPGRVLGRRGRIAALPPPLAASWPGSRWSTSPVSRGSSGRLPRTRPCADAYWDGWRVQRHLPDGTVDVIVELPVAKVTSCAFGGRDLRDLYVTTAAYGLTEEEREAQPAARAIFRVRVDSPGLPARRFTPRQN